MAKPETPQPAIMWLARRPAYVVPGAKGEDGGGGRHGGQQGGHGSTAATKNARDEPKNYSHRFFLVALLYAVLIP